MPQPPAHVRRAVARAAVVLTVLAGLQTLSAAPAMATGSPPATSAPGGSATPKTTSEPTPTPTPTSSASPSVTPTPTGTPNRGGADLQAAVAGPTAVDDTATTTARSPVRLAGASNDTAGSAPIQPALTVFPTDQLSSLPPNSQIDDGGRRLQVVGHGTFQISDQDGSVTFTPWTGLTGAIVVRYRIVDANGASDDGLLSVVVTAGGTSDNVFTYQDVDIRVDVLRNDVPGHNADGTPGTIDLTSARFPDQQTESGVTVSTDRRTLTYPTVGVLTLDDKGFVTFDPDPALSSPGTRTTLRYTAQDTTKGPGGVVEHHAYSATLDLGAHPDHIVTTDDELATPMNAGVELPGLLNDKETNPRLQLRPYSSEFAVDPVQPGDTLSYYGQHFTSRGRGSFSINGDGSVFFYPVRGFVGRAGVTMYVFDSAGTRSEEMIVADVQPGPTGRPDAGSTAQNVTRAFDVLANDVPGLDANGRPGTMNRTYVQFSVRGQPAGARVMAYNRMLRVPGQGVYTIDAVTGAISFDPEPRFTGTAGRVVYQTSDSVPIPNGRFVHNPTTSNLRVTVTPVTPVALNNWSSTTLGVPVEVPVLGNDRPGAASAPLVPSSVRLRLGPGLPSSSTVSNDGLTLKVPGRGTYVVRSDGVVVVTPAPGFTGIVPTVGYTVADTNGTTAAATVTVGVQPPGS